MGMVDALYDLYQRRLEKPEGFAPLEPYGPPEPKEPPTLGQRVMARMPGMAALGEGLATPQGQILANLLLPVRGRLMRSTITNPVHEPGKYSGIYKSPSQLLSEVQMAPESPWMKKLFGVNRADLWDISQFGTRKGNLVPSDYLQIPQKGEGAASAEKVTNPANAKRLRDITEAGLEDRDIREGMGPWYVMDPYFWKLRDLVGHEEAVRLFKQQSLAMTPFSAGADVNTEIPRGLAMAYLYDKYGKMGADKFVAHGGARYFNPEYPERDYLAQIGMESVPGHSFHSTSQAPVALQALLERRLRGDQPKVASYEKASGVPETGFQTDQPVGDAHLARGVGFPEGRTAPLGSQGWRGEITMPEARRFNPWFKEKVTDPLAIEPTTGQPILWGMLSKQTGVKTPIGASKLELLADHIANVTAPRLGISPAKARDLILRSKAYSAIPAAPFGATLLSQPDDQ